MGSTTGKRRSLLVAPLLAGSALVALAAPLAAQEAGSTVLETIVVEGEDSDDTGLVATQATGGTKTDTPIVETPQVVNVVTNAQIEAQGVESVDEALRYTPGVVSEANGTDVRYDWFWIRGFNSYGRSWLDGLPLPADPASYATPRIHPYALERVEVLKGPASVLYGATVPGGLVNQVGKRPEAVASHEAWVGTNNFGGIEGGLDATGPLSEDGQWLYRLVTVGEHMHTQVDMERDREFMVAPSLTWNPTADTSLTVNAYAQRDRDIFSPRFYPAYGTLLPNPAGQIPHDLFLGDPNADDFNRDYWHVGYEFSHQVNETWTVRQNLRYMQGEQDMFLALVNPAFAFGFMQPPSNVLQRVSAVSDDRLTSFTVDTQGEARFATGALDHTLLFGLDYVDTVSATNFGNSTSALPVPSLDYLNPVYGATIPVPPYTRSARQALVQTGFYAQDQIKVDRWVATLNLRYDMSEIETTDRLAAGTPTVTTSDEALTGRVGLAYLFDNGFAPYASYSTSFLPLLGTDRNNQPFKAQTAEQFEVGVRYEPLDGRGLVTLSLFQMTVENALTDDPVDSQFDVQTGEQRVRGLEIEGKYELTPELEILAGYAYSDSEVTKSNNPTELGREMLRVPAHQGTVWVNYSPAAVAGLSLSAGVRATSDYQSDPTYLPALRIPSRALVDIGAAYELGGLLPELEGATVQVNVSNLFDERYVSHCLNLNGGSCNYGDARTVTARLKYKW